MAFEQHNLLGSAESVSAEAWERWAAAVAEVGRRIVYDDPRAAAPLLRAEGVRSIIRTLASTSMTALEHDANYPRLVRLFDTYRQHGNANPDCVYLYAEVSPEHTYRIHGKRGGARLFEIQTMSAHMLAHPNHRGLDTATDLEAEPSGDISVVLSATPHAGNWVPLHPEARWIYVRQYYYDWETEQPADIVIEREGAAYPPPAMRPEWIRERIEMMAQLFPTFCQSAMNFVGTYYATPPGGFNFVLSKSGMAGLYYGKGHFEFRPDQAVILEFKPPPCLYWSIQVMNHFWESLDWDVRQTSLNGHQGRLDPDGWFRAVISLTDPGVPNWLDPAGHASGLICGRVLRPAAAPEAAMRVVPLESARDYLHPDTLRISAMQRSEQLRRRMLGVARRHRV